MDFKSNLVEIQIRIRPKHPDPQPCLVLSIMHDRVTFIRDVLGDATGCTLLELGFRLIFDIVPQYSDVLISILPPVGVRNSKGMKQFVYEGASPVNLHYIFL